MLIVSFYATIVSMKQTDRFHFAFHCEIHNHIRNPYIECLTNGIILVPSRNSTDRPEQVSERMMWEIKKEHSNFELLIHSYLKFFKLFFSSFFPIFFVCCVPRSVISSSLGLDWVCVHEGAWMFVSHKSLSFVIIIRRRRRCFFIAFSVCSSFVPFRFFLFASRN